MKLTTEQIAEVAHEANRVYAKQIGETKPTWADTPENIRKSAVAGVQWRIDNPWATAEEQHVQWLDYKIKEGWKVGPAIDPVAKTHPCLVPYAELPK